METINITSKHISLPRPFSEGDPNDWFQKYKIYCKANEWGDELRAKKLPNLLEGNALAIWLEMTIEQKGTYQMVKSRIVERMTPIHFVSIDKLFAALIGGVKFSKVDLTQAYQQMILDKDSRVYVTINTHLGLFRYTSLLFGIASVPAIFQRTIDTILQGLPHVQCYIDDIIITGSSEEEHLRNLEEVLKRLSHYGIRVKEDKCAFFRDKVEYLGHQISSEGVITHSTQES